MSEKSGRWFRGPFDLSKIPDREVVSTLDLATALDVSVATVSAWVREGNLPNGLARGMFSRADTVARLEQHNASFIGLISSLEIAQALSVHQSCIRQYPYFPKPVYPGFGGSYSKYRITDVLEALLMNGKKSHHELLAKATGMTDYSHGIGPFTYARAPGNKHSFTISCAVCAETEALTLPISLKNASDILPKKFSYRGWLVGKRPGKHRCPACQQKTTNTNTNPAPQQKAPAAMVMPAPIRIPGATPVMPLPLPARSAQDVANAAAKAIDAMKADPPRAASIDERRIINDKLGDVYAAKGYTAGWSDEKVAKDLGVPRAWVAQVREMLFGPDINEDEAKALAACQDVLNRMTQLRADMDRVKDRAVIEMTDLLTSAQQLMSEARALMTKAR